MLTPEFLRKSSFRLYIKKNHLYLTKNIAYLFMQSLTLSGHRARAEKFIIEILLRLKRFGTPETWLTASFYELSIPIDMSPFRMGKKVKMVPRISSGSRQLHRSIFVFISQIRTRKFQGKTSFAKVYREICAGLFFQTDSFRVVQHHSSYTTGFLNLRYLTKRWF